jgi:opacity protein-like surface antigen
MRKSLFSFIFLLLSVTGWAQSAHNGSDESSAGDIYIGYSLLNGDTLHNASGIEADFSANYESFSGAGARTYNMLFGPQLAHRVGKFRIYAHGLAGVAHFSGFGFTSRNTVGWALGGGVDYGLTSHFAFRPAQFDYLGSHFFSTTQKNFRYSGGLVYRF